MSCNVTIAHVGTLWCRCYNGILCSHNLHFPKIGDSNVTSSNGWIFPLFPPTLAVWPSASKQWWWAGHMCNLIIHIDPEFHNEGKEQMCFQFLFSVVLNFLLGETHFKQNISHDRVLSRTLGCTQSYTKQLCTMEAVTCGKLSRICYYVHLTNSLICFDCASRWIHAAGFQRERERQVQTLPRENLQEDGESYCKQL